MCLWITNPCIETFVKRLRSISVSAGMGHHTLSGGVGAADKEACIMLLVVIPVASYLMTLICRSRQFQESGPINEQSIIIKWPTNETYMEIEGNEWNILPGGSDSARMVFYLTRHTTVYPNTRIQNHPDEMFCSNTLPTKANRPWVQWQAVFLAGGGYLTRCFYPIRRFCLKTRLPGWGLLPD